MEEIIDVDSLLIPKGELQQKVLTVYAANDRSIVQIPRFDEWEIPEELWMEPRLIDDKVLTFERDTGVIRVHEPGIYRVSCRLSFRVYNTGLIPIYGYGAARIITGDILDRFQYTVFSVEDVDTFSSVIPPTVPPAPTLRFPLTLWIDADIIVEQPVDIAPQYRFVPFTAGIPEGLVVTRDTIDVRTFINVSKYLE